MTLLRIRTVLFIGLWVVCLNHMAYAQNELTELPKGHERFEILYHEILPPLVLESKVDDLATQSVESPVWSWSFESFGRSFDLTLESNHRLIAKLPPGQLKKVEKSHQLFRGKIIGLDDSWVRLTRSGNKWFGMIWDGKEIYIIDPMSVIEPALPGVSLAEHSAHGIYRLSDTRELETATCGLSSSGVSLGPINNYGALVQELQERVTANAEGATLNIDMAVVADVEFSTTQQNTYGTATNAAVIARINVVDGIFSEQVGVQINLVDIQALSSNGSLTSTNAFTLLQQFGALTSSSTFTHPGAAHLFTGKNLDGSTIGIAYLSSLCHSRFGIGVSEVTGGGTARALVVAHELGHNFGAPHDNQNGSACESTPGNFLMNPFINGSDEFSQCSLTQMQPEINSATCLTVINLTQGDLQMNFPSSPFETDLGVSFTYNVTVTNNGPGSANNASTTITVPSQLNLQNVSVNNGNCVSGGTGQVNCDLGNIPNGVTRTIMMTLQGQTVGQFTMQAVAAASNDQNISNNTRQGVISVLNPPTTNIPSITTPTPQSILTGSTVTFNWIPNGQTVRQWWVNIGSSQGAFDLADSGSLGTTRTYTATGLPTDGRTVWVRLWYLDPSSWKSVDFQYTAATQGGSGTPQMESPVPGSKLSGSNVTFNWIPNGQTVRQWWVNIGSSQGAFDLADSGSLGTTRTYTATGLPTDGRTVWVRLWYLDPSSWKSVDLEYTAAGSP